VALIVLAPALVLAVLLPAQGQQIHRNAFESNRTSWVKGTADLAVDETAHKMSDEVAHEGHRSEYIQINATQQGTHVNYYYPTSSAPITQDLTASVWVKSDRPGIQLTARVVLPKEADPASLEDRLITSVKGDTYRKVGAWQKLEIGRPVKLAQEQQLLLQNKLKRTVNFQDAYIDQLVLNVFGGLGETNVWIDELEIGPVLDTPKVTGTTAPAGKGAAPATAAGKFVEFNQFLTIDGKRFFPRMIRYTDTPPDKLRSAGFNTIFVDYPWNPKQLKQMADLGLWVVPSLPVTSKDPRFVSAEGMTAEVRSFPEPDSLLFWNLGTALAYEENALVEHSARLLVSADRNHAVGADAWDGLGRYSANVNLLGIHRWPLMTMMELNQYKDWLEMRSRLASPGTFLWTWIQTHLPDSYTQLVYNQPATAAFSEPVGPQPEQIRLLTYLAVGSGFRGLGFWSDRFLAESHQGTDRLLTVFLLNQELEFLEPMLNTSDGTTQWIETSDPNVQAAVLRTQKGILVLPMWLGGASQCVPGQSALGKLTMVVPQVPPSFQCWEVTPGQVSGITPERDPGGLKITVKDFGLTTSVAFTSDLNLIKRFQELCALRRQLAANYTYDLAVQELAKVAKVQEQLERIGQDLTDPELHKKCNVKPGDNILKLPDADALMKDAYSRLKEAKSLYENHRFGDAYKQAQYALRPARILMRAQWDRALIGLDSCIATPYLGSYYTLPRHWEFMKEVLALKPGKNVLVGGDFEAIPGKDGDGWRQSDATLDEVDLQVRYVAELPLPLARRDPKAPAPLPKDPKTPKFATKLTPKEGKQFVVLEVKPKSIAQGLPPPKALERTCLAFSSPPAALTPGSLVQISGWVAIPVKINASAEGVVVMDSSGGDTLAFRQSDPTEKKEKDYYPVDWRKFTLFRRVPANGIVTVTLNLTGMGRAAFDDIQIQPMVPPSSLPIELPKKPDAK
jgi:hypothetical protein